MKNILLGSILIISSAPILAADYTCPSIIKGYRLVKNSVYPFRVGTDSACFFAFYVTNPNRVPVDCEYGNSGDSIWYGYFKISNPKKIYQLPKPINNSWTDLCEIDAISFKDMNNDKKQDITIIGSCEYDVMNYSFPIVYIQTNNTFVSHKKTYLNLLRIRDLTVADVYKYINTSDPYNTYYDILADKY